MADVDEATVRSDARQWRGLLVTGAWCAFASVVMIVVQIPIYVVWPPPETAEGFFELLLDNPVLGLVSLDVLYVVSNAVMYLVYLELAVVLWRVSRSAVVIAVAFCVVGIAAFMSSSRPVEMLSLAHAYADADADAETRTALLATGDGMMATWAGTGYDIYYYFTFVTLAVLAVLMLRSSIFSRATAVWGLVSAALMTIPTNFGTVGMVFAIASLVPFSVFAVLVGIRLLELASPENPAAVT
ncbi:MAG: DUF4386 family protein [Rhodococcus sp. (in: high G+C Gram-positive bacteria)]